MVLDLVPDPGTRSGATFYNPGLRNHMDSTKY